MVLNIRNIGKTYRGAERPVQPLADFSLSVGPGEFVAVRGASGSGKTTLLLIAGGLLRPDAGQVMVADQDLYQMNPEARARFRAGVIGFVFQQFHLIPYLSVLENVLTPALGKPGPDLKNRAMDLIDHFGLGPRKLHVPAQLSTGERQRTALARALLHQPKLLLADEPTGNLDDGNGQIVLDYMTEFVRGGGALLLVTHDTRAAQKAQRLIQLEPKNH